jgi:riboflavin kinase/FMN adenylyltransferase
MEEAEAAGGTVVVMTFDRHPASITRPEIAPKLLTRTSTKLELMEAMGVPVVLLLEFNETLASIPAEEFLRSFPSSLHKICVGSQWSFGHRGLGNIPLLKSLGEELGFSVVSVEPVEMEGMAISSTRIRKAVACGDFSEASACLGREFLLIGSVVTGAGLGTKIGFPTANLDVSGMQLPPDGVYAVKVQLGGEELGGVINIGVRPTVDVANGDRTAEVHLFDFHADLVGKALRVKFIQFLRGEEKFPSLDALTSQIALDCERARETLI